MSDDEQLALATTAGQRWAQARAQELNAQDRAVVGGWPGTLREAKAHVLTALRGTTAAAPDVERLDHLARAATAAARRAWNQLVEPDLER